MPETLTSPNTLDAVVPPEMAQRAERVGVAKVRMPAGKTFVLAVLAGAFIAQGAIFATVAVSGTSDHLPYGVVRLLGGLAFCLGLVLVVVAGAELFTGNNLIVMAAANRQIRWSLLARNWVIVYLGNFVGCAATALLIFFTQQHTFGGGAIGRTMLAIGQTKCQLDFFQAISLGVACNALVCLAVWLCFAARSTTDKIASIIFPISAFVAAGFEHCVANMYFIPAALLVKAGADDPFWTSIGAAPGEFDSLTWGNLFVVNLLPVTIGNIIGGGLMVGIVYWFVYLRNSGDE
jgi:formate/nitrite transporter